MLDLEVYKRRLRENRYERDAEPDIAALLMEIEELRKEKLTLISTMGYGRALTEMVARDGYWPRSE